MFCPKFAFFIKKKQKLYSKEDPSEDGKISPLNDCLFGRLLLKDFVIGERRETRKEGREPLETVELLELLEIFV